MMRSRISRSKYLEILQNRLEMEKLGNRDFVQLAKVYADVAGWKDKASDKRRKKRELEKLKKQQEKETAEPDVNELILRLEKEHKGA